MTNLSTSRSGASARRRLLKWATAGLVIVCCGVSATAVDPNRMMSQYLRDSWGTERGFPGGVVSSFAQTPDGYLWIGTDKGLIRFDGLNFRKFEQASPSPFTIGPVRSLLADAQGNLWILLQSTKLLRYRDGAFEISRGEAENGVTAIGHDMGGAVLLSSLAMGVLTYNGERFVSVSQAQESDSSRNAGSPDELSTRLSWSTGLTPHRVILPNSAVTSMAQTSDGMIWLGTQDGGIFHLSGGRLAAVANKLPGAKINCLLPLNNSELWIGTSKGVLLWNGAELTRAAVPSPLMHIEVLSLLRDRDANIWVGTSRGLSRLNPNSVSSAGTLKTDSPANALLEDREGNIWTGDKRGLERLRDSAFVTYSIPGLKSQSMGPLHVDSDNRIWFAPIEGGLRWLKGGRSGSVNADGISKDIVYSLSGGAKGSLWVGRQRGGLTHVLYVNGAFTARTYTKADGLAQNSVYAVHESRDGTIWSGTLSGGVSEFRNGHFTTYTTANGLVSNTISSIGEGVDGTMFFGTPNGVSALSKDGWRSYGIREGLASPNVNCLLQDSSGVLWIGTAEGLALLTATKIRVPQGMPDSLREPILGMAEDRNERLWIATANHVLKVKRGSLMANAVGDADVREYVLADGLQGTEGVKRYQSVVADSKGQVWFSTNRGLSVVDPAREAVNSTPALIHLEAMSADGNALGLHGPIRIPAAKQRITFHYIGLSLGNSERVRYRYRLDGFDQGWSEATTNREATYGNLSARSYRFRVVASNSNGIWSSTEAAIQFEVEPTLWQTWWFRLACVLCAGLTALAVYRVRMSQLTRLLNIRFEERLAERTRIAQELHDTLLQGVLSISMQLHVAVDLVPEELPARPILNRILQLSRQVIEEGRNTIRGLRSSIESAHDLENSFSRIPQELGEDQDIEFRVVVEGACLPLRPAIRDDVYSIGREAVVNAFRHSGANNIDVHLEYAANQLRILVQDNGRGIDPQVLHFGRDGHWGLAGMRERAERIGGKLKVLSRIGDGTEVEFCLPRDLAWEFSRTRLAPHWFSGTYRQPRKRTEPQSNQRVEGQKGTA